MEIDKMNKIFEIKTLAECAGLRVDYKYIFDEDINDKNKNKKVIIGRVKDKEYLYFAYTLDYIKDEIRYFINQNEDEKALLKFCKEKKLI